MLKTVIFSINLLIVALVVGTMFGIWLGLNPKQLSYPVYLGQQQQLIKSLNVMLPMIAAVGIVFTLISAYLSKGDSQVFWMLIVAAVLLIIAGIITRFLNQPINAKMMTWVVENPPTEWMKIRDDWWRWHIIRMISGIAGLCLLIVGLLINRPIN